MKAATRDILVLAKNENLTPTQLESELLCLEAMLLGAESKKSFCIANEIIDVNRYKIFTSAAAILKAIKTIHQPFVFICNKN